MSTVGSTTKPVYWDINQRAAVGENILHLCFLNATRVHYEIAKIIIKKYPPLVNDIYIGDEYYGKKRSIILTLIRESNIFFTFSAHFCLQHFICFLCLSTCLGNMEYPYTLLCTFFSGIPLWNVVHALKCTTYTVPFSHLSRTF